ncbi:hypothetical protein [Microbacterium invictum]|uniref:Bacterial Ig-like domain-containing protein n=1 Tax=Microbacterium invictum TaxID=515415 RepID=A0ABZ0VAF1_9MICO|nr:hypothetical protein [Microbacterium invictum]WQB70600.1 hypothetical protein T9R20_01165 [Microbacterium invictum]
MRTRSTPTLGTAALAAALIAAPLPAIAAEADAATGTLTVTRFDDRYADGLYDPSKTAPSGDVDRKNESAPRVLAADGTWRDASANGDGDFVFEGLPLGETEVHFLFPNSPGGEVFFDATDAASAADIEQLPVGSFLGSPTGVASVTVDSDGESLLVGMSALRLVADVQFADGEPASGLATVELGSGDSWYPATEYDFQPGTYESFWQYGYIRHLPGDLGVRVTPPAGFRVASVTAADVNELTVTERDGAWYFPSSEVLNYFWNPTFTVTLEELPDTTRPTATLVSPSTAGPFSALDIRVDATDDRGLNRIVANIYRDGVLVKSTQSAVGGATSGTHTAAVVLPDGAYTVRYNAQDLAGNISRTGSFSVTVDATAPTVTVKDGVSFTRGADGTYDLVSFKLYDAGKIDRVELNGVAKNLTNNAWSDVNFVKPGTFRAVAGENTLVVYDVAGNARTVTFTLN